MIKSFLVAICFGICLFGLAQSKKQSQSAIVKTEATIRNASFLNLIPVGQESEYGFANRADFAKVTIGEPYQMYFVIRESAALKLKDGQEWRVPLLVNGNAVALLTVVVNNGVAKAIDFGGAALARKLQEFEKQHIGEKNDRILVRNTFLSKDFLAMNLAELTIPDSNGSIAIKSTSNAVLFPISATNQAAIKPAQFVAATLAAQISK